MLHHYRCLNYNKKCLNRTAHDTHTSNRSSLVDLHHLYWQALHLCPQMNDMYEQILTHIIKRKKLRVVVDVVVSSRSCMFFPADVVKTPTHCIVSNRGWVTITIFFSSWVELKCSDCAVPLININDKKFLTFRQDFIRKKSCICLALCFSLWMFIHSPCQYPCLSLCLVLVCYPFWCLFVIQSNICLLSSLILVCYSS